MKNHYLYLLLGEDGRFYYGVRSCKCDPQEDVYMGSYHDTTFKPKRKRVLSIWDSREAALAEEVRIHSLKDVAANPRYANRAKQTSVSFDTTGVTLNQEHKARIGKGSKQAWEGRDDRREERRNFLIEWNKSEDHKDRIRGERNPMRRPDVKEKLREANLGEKNPQYGKPTSKKQKEAARLAHKDRPKTESQRAKMSSSATGRRLITNGDARKWLRDGCQMPEGWNFVKHG